MVDDRKRGGPIISGRPPAFTLQHLRYAVLSADHGSFRRAADALLLRQSTLSRCIRQLEDSIGLAVFDRSSGGVRATAAGRNFLRSARRILEQIDALATTAQEVGRGDVGRIVIGFHVSLSAGELRATLLEYARRFPDVQTGLLEGSRARLAGTLRDGAIDIAIVTGETPIVEGNAMQLWNERIVVALPGDHVLATKPTLSWIDLRGETILLSESDSGAELQHMVMEQAALPGEHTKIIRHSASRGSIKSLVGAGVGISVMSEAALGASFGGLSYRDLIDKSGPILIAYAAHWRDDNDNPALASFLALLRERYSAPAANS